MESRQTFIYKTSSDTHTSLTKYEQVKILAEGSYGKVLLAKITSPE